MDVENRDQFAGKSKRRAFLYHTAKPATMIFDNNTRIENDPRGEIRKFWEQMPQPTSPLG